MTIHLGDISHKDLDAALAVMQPGKGRSKLTPEQKELLFMGAMLMKACKEDERREHIERMQNRGQKDQQCMR